MPETTTKQRANNRLAALGGAHVNAMSDRATGAEGNKREQDVHTPDCILEVVRATFGGVIELDPCASHTRESFATLNTYAPAGDGLSHSWPQRTYFNPPYAKLKSWLAHAKDQPEFIGLYPVRTNRAWWMDFHINNVDVIAWLKPLAFAGHKQAFPAPLVLVYGGTLAQRGGKFIDVVKTSGLAHRVTEVLKAY